MKHLIAVTVMILSTAATVHGQAVTELYEARSYTAPKGRYAETPLPYRLMKPAQLEPGKRYPLVVFLHGAGERGRDNVKQLSSLPTWLAEPEMREKYPCYLVAPQCPDDRIWASIDWREQRRTYSD